MSFPGDKKLLYLHSNESSLSTIQFQRLPTQVSSVGFNTLKSQTTGSSLNLIVTTAGTIKSNSLTKLFTRNKSHVNSEDDFNAPVNSENLSIKSNEEEPSNITHRTSSLFKVLRMLRAKLKFGNKAARPDLTIQTSGHHTLKVPKKLLSSASSEDFGNKKIVPSPITRGLFHRQHNSTRSESQQSGIEEAVARHLYPKQRAAVGLSSQSSNSYISDVNIAVNFNFTNPDFMAKDENDAADNLTFLDFHRIYMTSADHFISAKSHKSEMERSDSEERFNPASPTAQANQEISKMLDGLYEKISPLCQITIRKPSFGEAAHPRLSVTLEQASNYVNEMIHNAPPGSYQSHDLERRESTGEDDRRSLGLSNEPHSKNNAQEEFVDLRQKEHGRNILQFFERCFASIVEDLNSAYDSNTASLEVENLHPAKQVKESAMSLRNYLSNWKRVEHIWRHFNTNMRFFLLSIFEKLQDALESDRNYRGINRSYAGYQIESALFTAFRDIVLVPHLMLRPSSLDHSRHVLLIEEANPDVVETEYFNSKGEAFVRSLQLCFGEIATHLPNDNLVHDDQPLKELIFDEYAHWFEKYIRSRACP